MCLENVDHHSIILRDNKMHLLHSARVGEGIGLLKPKLLQPEVHNGCGPPKIKKQALCLLVKPTPNTDNSITSRPPRFRSTALSFLARWAKRKLSYCTFALLLGHLQCGSVSTRRVLPVRWHKAGSFARLAFVFRFCVPCICA